MLLIIDVSHAAKFFSEVVSRFPSAGKRWGKKLTRSIGCFFICLSYDVSVFSIFLLYILV